MQPLFSRISWLACIWFGWAGSALADPLESVELQLSSADRCALEEASLRRDAAALLPTAGRYGAIVITLSVRPVEQGYRLRLTLRGEDRQAERHLLVKSCEEARQTAALMVALSVDPDAGAMLDASLPPGDEGRGDEGRGGEAVRQEPEREEAVAPPALPVASAPADRSPGSHPAWRPPAGPPDVSLELALRALGDSGVLPTPSVGPGAAVGARLTSLWIEATCSWLLSRDVAVDGHSSARAQAGLWTVGLAGCYVVPLSAAWSFGPCGVIETGLYTGSSSGVSHTHADHTTWLALGASAASSVKLAEALSLEASLGLLSPLRRPVLSFRDLGEVYVVPGLSVRGLLGVRWHIGSSR